MTHPADLFMPTHSALATLSASIPKLTQTMLVAVVVERDRQNALVAEGKLPFNCSAFSVRNGDKLMVLGEEFGEVAKAAYEIGIISSDMDAAVKAWAHLREELIQLAAVAVAWSESITVLLDK